ncbi:MAG: hypothetical protein D6726_02795, partial [Nitrospirae bacterium]
SCAPVISKDIMTGAILNPSIRKLQESPDQYKERMFVIGGRIVDVSVTEEGSFIEAVQLNLDDNGYVSDGELTEMGRFIVRLKKDRGIIDPALFKEGADFTLAGRFAGLREGMLDKRRYRYPVFDLIEIHLWEEPQPVYVIEPFPGWYYYPYPVYRDYWWRPHRW